MDVANNPPCGDLLRADDYAQFAALHLGLALAELQCFAQDEEALADLPEVREAIGSATLALHAVRLALAPLAAVLEQAREQEKKAPALRCLPATPYRQSA